MNEQLQQDLDYIAGAVRRNHKPAGEPAIFFLWALIVGAGFALPDFAPHWAGPFWLVAGIGGGLLSMWLGMRGSNRSGMRDAELGKRYGLHWGIGGLASLLIALPMLTGRAQPEAVASDFLLLAGLLYALAGVHLQRGLLWSGLMMLAAYAALTAFALPYTWTATGLAIAVALACAGLSAQRQTLAGPRA